MLTQRRTFANTPRPRRHARGGMRRMLTRVRTIVTACAPFSYADATPNGYACASCGAVGCKLWREYQTFLNHQSLACCDCAARIGGKDITSIDANGYTTNPKYGYKSDQIGWRIPAVPTEDGSTFWGYSSVPEEGVAWWRGLPTRPIVTP